MDRIVVCGAGGRAGRASIAEARRRGHAVTAVGRRRSTPARPGRCSRACRARASPGCWWSAWRPCSPPPTASLDRLIVSPSGDVDHGAGRTGRYRTAPGDAASRISYADLAVALLDEIEAPKYHRIHVGVEAAP